MERNSVVLGYWKPIQRSLILAAVLLLGVMASASPARAAIGLAGLEAAPANPDAGAHSDFHVHIDVTSPADQLRDLTVSLPPGLAGNPQSVPKCPPAQLNADNCPGGSQIGTTSVQLTAASLLPMTVNGSVYNVTPEVGEPARLGIVLRPPDPTGLLLPPIVQQVEVELRPDFGLDTLLTDLPQNAAVLNLLPVPIAINSIDLDLAGSFMSNPTSCGTKTTGFSARSWAMAAGDPPATGTASFESVNCASQPFDPQASLEIDGNGQPLAFESRPTVTSVIEQEAGQANNESVSVVLPGGLGVDASKFNQVCEAADFEAGSCAETTRLGSATAVSPLLDSELTGPVYAVAGDGLPQVGVDLKGTLPLKILGSSGFKEGRVATSFAGLPDLPLSRFELVFPGGPSGLLRVVDDVCGAASTFSADFTSQAGQTVSKTVPATVKGTCPGNGGNGNGNGGNGNGNQVKAPKATIQVKGAKRHRPRASIRLRSGGAGIKAVRITLPAALKLRRGAAGRLVIKAGGKRIKGPRKVVARGRTIKLKALPRVGAVRINIGPAALARPAKVRKGSKVVFRLKVMRQGRKPASLKVPARVRK